MRSAPRPVRSRCRDCAFAALHGFRHGAAAVFDTASTKLAAASAHAGQATAAAFTAADDSTANRAVSRAAFFIATHLARAISDQRPASAGMASARHAIPGAAFSSATHVAGSTAAGMAAAGGPTARRSAAARQPATAAEPGAAHLAGPATAGSVAELQPKYCPRHTPAAVDAAAQPTQHRPAAAGPAA